MIVVKLKGGLGNQMFQYAFGRSLSINYHTDLLLNISDLADISQPHTYRNYALNIFNIKADTKVDKFEIERRKKIFPFNFFRFIKKKNNLKCITEKTLYFDKDLGKVTDNVYLDGYWQSPYYFIGIEDTIKKDFCFLNSVSKKSESILAKIKATSSVSIHVRRGDYLNNPETKAYHGICEIDYYVNAMEILKKNVSSPLFFIFSDDPDWVIQNFPVSDECILVSKINSGNQYDDLQLMTHCKHAIIANSSFSWWGAWLIKNPDKVVIAPEKWLQDTSINTDNLFPSSWIRI